MKYLFFVHTHITYYVSIAIIEKLKLENKDYGFIISRKYNNALTKLEGLDVSELNEDIKNLSYFQFKQRTQLISTLDKAFSEYWGQSEFRLFVPHIADPLMQALARHHLCMELNFIEEGANCYSKDFFKPSPMSIKTIAKRCLNLLDFNRNSRYSLLRQFEFTKELSNKVRRFYSISDRGFEHAVNANKVVLNLPKIAIDLKLNSKVFVVLEAAIENKQIGNQKIYFDSVKHMLKFASNGLAERSIQCKYHPAQSQFVISRITRIANDLGIKLEPIPNDIPFEQILRNFSDIKVFGFTSSLLYYAKIFGHDVISFEELLLRDYIFSEFRSNNDFDLKGLLSSG